MNKGMSDRIDAASRRTVLKLTGASLAAVAGSGVASADHEHPNVETDPAQMLTSDSAELHGDLLDIGDSADFASVWFEWGPRGEGFPNWTTSRVRYSPGEFSDTISGLDRGDYQFRAVAKDSDDGLFTAYGDTRYFTAGHKK